MDTQEIYGNPLLVEVDLEMYPQKTALEGGEDEKEGIAEVKDEGTAEVKDDGGRVSSLGEQDSPVKMENAEEDDEESNTDNEADQKDQEYQQVVEKDKQQEEENNKGVKKSDSDNNLLTMEDRAKATTENLEIIRVGDAEQMPQLDHDELPVQESQIVNPLPNLPSVIGDKADDDFDDDYDIFANSEKERMSKNVSGDEPGSQSLANDPDPDPDFNIDIQNEPKHTIMTLVNNPMQSQFLDESHVAQSMMENSSVMNMSSMQPQNLHQQNETMMTEASQLVVQEPEPSIKAIMKNQEYYDIIEKLERFTREGKFNQSVAVIQEHLLKVNSMLEGDQKSVQMNIVDQEMNILLNELLIFNYIKLKEFQNARSMALECIKKYSKSGLFSVGKNSGQSSSASSELVPFCLKFMNSVAIYNISNSRNKKSALIELYELQRVYHYDYRKSNLGQMDHFSLGNKKNDPLITLILREKDELFGLFPPQNDRRSMHIMISMEIARIHHRAQDYRNAYTVLTRLNDACPNNAMIISKIGRFCLEIGKKTEAVSHFSMIQDMIQRKKSQAKGEMDARAHVGDAPKPESTDLIDDLLIGRSGSEANQNSIPADKETQQLIVVNLLNQGFVCIFDANYEEAIKYFRQVQTIRPANIVAANNLATAKIFTNKVGESIKTLEDLLKKDPQAKINDQVVANLQSMYEIWFANNTKEKKAVLNKFCVDNAKDSVVSTITLQQQQSRIQAKKR